MGKSPPRKPRHTHKPSPKATLRYDFLQECVKECALVGVLLAFAVIWSNGISRYVLDPDVWDEAGTLSQGLHFVQGLFHQSIEWGTFYPAWYWVISKLQPDPLALYYLMGRLLCILIPMAIYFFCRRAYVNRIASFLSAFLFAVFPPLVTISRWSSHFVIIVLFTGFGLAVRSKKREDFIGGVTLTCALASLVRPEFEVSFLVSFLGYLFLLGKDRVKPIQARVVSVVSCSIPLLYGFFWPSNGGMSRSFYVFQYYTAQRVQTNGGIEDLFRRLYGPAHSVTQAAFANPLEFLRHVLFSFVVFLKLLPEFFAAYRYLFESALGSFALIALLTGWLYNRIESRKLPTADVRPRKHPKLERILLLWTLVAAPIVGAASVFGLTPRYMLPMVAFTIVAAFALSRPWRFRPALATALLLSGAAIAAPPNFFDYSYTRRFFGFDLDRAPREGEMAQILSMRLIPVNGQKRVVDFAENVFSFVPNADGIPYCQNDTAPCPETPRDSDGGIWSLRSRFDFNMISAPIDMNSILERMKPCRFKRQLQALLAHPDAFGFKEFKVPCASTAIYVDKRVLGPNPSASEIYRAAAEKGCPEGI